MNWFKSKEFSSLKEVKCSNCGQTQTVSDKVSAVFCKKCRKTIFTKDATLETSSHQVNTTSDISLDNEKVESKPETVNVAVSKPLAANSTPNSSPLMSSTTKQIKCSNCKTSQTVPSIALASFCEKCGQRINLQDYKIKGHFHGELETRGKICIAEGSIVQANLNVGSAIIEGKISGKIIAESKVELMPGCFVQGLIQTPLLVMHDGAGFVGKAIVGVQEAVD